jgi:hypothetical protein
MISFIIIQPLNTEEKPFHLFGRSFENCRWSPSSFNARTTRRVAVMEQEDTGNKIVVKKARRLLRFDFYAVTASRYYTAVA